MNHSALAWLPDALRDAGVPFVELDGWTANQPRYYWRNPDGTSDGYHGHPTGAMWHHTATNVYEPYVRNRLGRTKANLWMGLRRPDIPDRLHATGMGTPTVVLASSGPANYSSGAGRREVLTDYVAKDRRFPGPQTKLLDNSIGNRHYLNTETVHPGDGSTLHPGVWDLQLRVAVILSKHFGWSAWRHIGHLDHTRRKIDPRFSQGAPYTIGTMQDQIAARLVVSTPPPPPPDEELLYMAYADTLSLEEWVATIRPVDIDDLWAKGVHTGDKQYWKNQLAVPPDQWTNQQVDAWENFRRTTSARTAWL